MSREAAFLRCPRNLAGAFIDVTRARMSRARSSMGSEAASSLSMRVSDVASTSFRSTARRARAASSRARRSSSVVSGSRRRPSFSAMASRISARVLSCCPEVPPVLPALSAGEYAAPSAIVFDMIVIFLSVKHL